MYNGKHKSFKSVLWRVMKHSFCSDLSEEQAADYALELIKRLKSGFLFGDGNAYLCVNNFRAPLPLDLVNLRGMRYLIGSQEVIQEEEIKDDFLSESFIDSMDISATRWLPIKFTGNIYQTSFETTGKDGYDIADSNITYTINNNYIYLSEESCIIHLAYKAILVDDECYPLIPDNQAFEDALYYYILKEHLFGLRAVGKVSKDFYEEIKQEYAWYVGQATNNLKLAGMDNWEEAMTGIRRMIQPQNVSDYGFKELHNREQIKRRHGN